MTRVLRFACLIPLIVVAELVVPSAAPSQAVAAQATGAACTPYTRGGISDVFDAPTFERVMEESALIVEATVSTVVPISPPPGFAAAQRQFTDVTLVASRVLKGSAPAGPFLVSQYADVGFFEMRPGQRFILLLDPVSDQERERSTPPSSQRYRSANDALLCIDGDRVHLGRDRYGSRFENRLLTDVVSDILGYLNLPRIRGRIAVEAGQFPPANVLFELPVPDWDHRGRLRIVITASGELAANQPRASAAILAPPSSPMYASTAASAGIDAPPSGEPAPRLFTIDSAGAFEMPLAPGTYQLSVASVPFGYAVTSIRFNGRSATDGTIRVERDGATDLTVTLGATTTGVRVTGQISGIPTDVPLETFSLLMIPESTTGAAAGTARPGRDGTFEFTSVPPGRYTVRTMATPAPAGTTWGALSSTVVTVEREPLTLDIPMFTGAEGRVRTRDAAGNLDPGQPARLTFDNDRGTRVYAIVSNGEARFWLPRGDFYARVEGTGGYGRVISNGANLFLTPIRSDGVTPLPPIDVIVERQPGR